MAEHYRALTRKYRPQSFEDIVSQEHVSNTLLNAIKQNRLSHAYMFCGPRGVGKTTMARVLARTINQIDSQVDGEALNQTLNIIEMDAASNNKVEDVHHLRESVRIPPQNGRYKVFIVDEVHMLSKAAFNALLKTLEEPPQHAIFIFATTEPHKVLPTILSRVQRFDFKRIGVTEIVERLRGISRDEHIAIDDESLHVIAKKADGALRDALGLMDQAIAFCGDAITHEELLKALNVVGTDRLFEFMETVSRHDADAGLFLINTLLQEGYDIQEFLIGLAEHLRNLYVAQNNEHMFLVEASPETKERYKASASSFSREDVLRMLHMVSEAQIKLKDATQPRIQFELTLLKLIHMQRTETLQTLMVELDALKKKANSPSVELPAKERTSLAPEHIAPATEDEPQPNPISVAEPQHQDTVEHQEQLPVAEEDDISLGRPAIQTEVTEQYLQQRVIEQPLPEPVVEAAPQVISTPKKVTLDVIKEHWQSYLDQLKEEVPMMLMLQIERTQPSKLEGASLDLQVDSTFGAQLITKNRQTLENRLAQVVGQPISMHPIVVNNTQHQEQRKSPYERFKDLQQRDPIIKELVTLFGAELEY
ncbi:MAG: DNA polymerase III subunit gamma/tau [Bacteroidota bacterium]